MPQADENTKKPFEIIFQLLVENWLGMTFDKKSSLNTVLLKDTKWGNNTRKPPAFYKVKFLYALTLFRQSRHPAAILSEATIPCPYRFNIDGIDNDLIRTEKARIWIEDLSKDGILLAKPAGYQWKYRDIRTGIRHFIECIGPVGEIKSSPKGKNGKTSPRLNYFGESRARTHYWIGEWYNKSFLSSGHYLPLIESVYHRLQAVKWAPFSKPDSHTDQNNSYLNAYRRHMINISVADALKTVILGQESFKFWLPGMEVNGFSSDGLDDFWGKSMLENIEFLDSLKKLNEEWRPPLWNDLLRELDILINCLPSGAPTSKRSMAGATKRKSFPNFTFPHESSFEKSVEQYRSIDIVEDHLIEEKGFSRFSAHFRSPLIGSTKRNRPSYYNSLNYILRKNSKAHPETVSKKLSLWYRNWIHDNTTENGTVRQIESINLAWLLFEFAYALSKRARFQSRFSGKASGATACRTWVAVCMTCYNALKFTRLLHPNLLDYEMQTKSKCLTLYGLALGYLGRFNEAHRRFNEAHSVLSKTKLGLKGVPFAALNLRRAEVYTQQAHREIQSIKRSSGKNQEKIFRIASAHINDAWAASELAESALSGLSHSSTWWYRLDNLRLEVFVLWGRFIEKALVQRNSPITNIGFEGIAFKRHGDLLGGIQLTYERAISVCDWSPLRQSCLLLRASEALNRLLIPTRIHTGGILMVNKENLDELYETLNASKDLSKETTKSHLVNEQYIKIQTHLDEIREKINF